MNRQLYHPAGSCLACVRRCVAGGSRGRKNPEKFGHIFAIFLATLEQSTHLLLLNTRARARTHEAHSRQTEGGTRVP